METKTNYRPIYIHDNGGAEKIFDKHLIKGYSACILYRNKTVVYNKTIYYKTLYFKLNSETKFNRLCSL